MNYILFDGPSRNALLPFTYTRPVADIRIGILTIREKWERHLGYTTTTVTEDYLSELFPMVEMEENILINASFLPEDDLVAMIRDLKPGEAVFYEEEVIAFFTTDTQEEVDLESYKAIEYEGKPMQVSNTWDIFSKNKEALKADFKLITAGRQSAPISETNTVMHADRIFLEEGARVECAVLNAEDGPIYIGKDALVMEGSLIRGGFALGEGSIVKMGARIYGATTAGPGCKLGGEINNIVMFANSNKGHDGFIGNSVVGEWCNIGADSNTSNLKNNYAPVRLWDYGAERFAPTGLQFCGLMMGDHSKCGINTMFNTGTVVGVSANIFGSGFPRNFIPSFSWGGASGFTTFKPVKAFEAAEAMMQRRGKTLLQEEKDILEEVFEQTKKWRKD